MSQPTTLPPAPGGELVASSQAHAGSLTSLADLEAFLKSPAASKLLDAHCTSAGVASVVTPKGNTFYLLVVPTGNYSVICTSQGESTKIITDVVVLACGGDLGRLTQTPDGAWVLPAKVSLSTEEAAKYKFPPGQKVSTTGTTTLAEAFHPLSVVKISFSVKDLASFPTQRVEVAGSRKTDSNGIRSAPTYRQEHVPPAGMIFAISGACFKVSPSSSLTKQIMTSFLGYSPEQMHAAADAAAWLKAFRALFPLNGAPTREEIRNLPLRSFTDKSGRQNEFTDFLPFYVQPPADRMLAPGAHGDFAAFMPKPCATVYDNARKTMEETRGLELLLLRVSNTSSQPADLWMVTNLFMSLLSGKVAPQASGKATELLEKNGLRTSFTSFKLVEKEVSFDFPLAPSGGWNELAPSWLCGATLGGLVRVSLAGTSKLETETENGPLAPLLQNYFCGSPIALAKVDWAASLAAAGVRIPAKAAVKLAPSLKPMGEPAKTISYGPFSLLNAHGGLAPEAAKKLRSREALFYILPHAPSFDSINYMWVVAEIRAKVDALAAEAAESGSWDAFDPKSPKFDPLLARMLNGTPLPAAYCEGLTWLDLDRVAPLLDNLAIVVHVPQSFAEVPKAEQVLKEVVKSPKFPPHEGPLFGDLSESAKLTAITETLDRLRADLAQYDPNAQPPAPTVEEIVDDLDLDGKRARGGAPDEDEPATKRARLADE